MSFSNANLSRLDNGPLSSLKPSLSSPKQTAIRRLVARPVLLALLVLHTARGATTQFFPPMVAHGSFAMVIICKDGIVVATDSRGTIENSRGGRLGYYDDVQKLFLFNHHVRRRPARGPDCPASVQHTADRHYRSRCSREHSD
jgi:hypothetical protein